MAGNGAKTLETRFLGCNDVLFACGVTHFGEIGLARMFEISGIVFERGVSQIVVVGFVEAFNHLESCQHVDHAVGHADVRVDFAFVNFDVFLKRLAGNGGEVQHVEFVTEVAQDGILQLAVITKAAWAGELHQHVCSKLKVFDIVAKDVLERRANKVARMLAAQFNGAFC